MPGACRPPDPRVPAACRHCAAFLGVPAAYRHCAAFLAGFLLLVGSLLLGACAAGPPADASTRIQPYADNPRYWQMDGGPVMLLGGSKEDNLFQIEDLEGHLDELVAAGGNYVRNTMSSRDSGNVWPFARTTEGLYDLERASEAYYDRFAHLLELAEERGVIVQIELWDRFDYARAPWLSNPFRPANNVNYTVAESGLENAYAAHPNENENPFFRSIPAEDDNRLILRYQQAHIDRLLERSLAYPNVLYTMDNETSATPEWGAYWARYVQDAAERAGVPVYATEMWDAWDLRDEQHRRTLDHPELYAFADVSQNNHNSDQEHWDNLQWVRRYTSSAPRPLNNVKIYGADGGRFGTSRDGVERFWRSIIGGAASARFHRPESGIGLSAPAKAHLTSARMLVEAFDLFRAVPDARSERLMGRTPDEAYLSFVEGEGYAVYFPDGGAVELRVEPGSYGVRWLDVEARRWQPAQPIEAGGSIPLTAPGGGHWVALVETP